MLVLLRLPADVNSSTCYDLSANATATVSDKRDDASGMSVLLAKSACPSVRPSFRTVECFKLDDFYKICNEVYAIGGHFSRLLFQ